MGFAVNFSDLQTEVNLLVIDTPTAVQVLVPRFINRAIRKLQSKHDFKATEASFQVITEVGTRRLDTVPTDWKKPRGRPYITRRLGGSKDIFFTSNEAEARVAYGGNTDLDYGEPALINEHVVHGVFEVYPYPDGMSDYDDGEYRINILYWKTFPDLVAPSDHNWFTDNAEQWIIYQSVAEAFYAIEDEDRAKLWEQRAAREYLDVIKIDKYRRLADFDTLAYHTGALRPHTQE